MLEAINKHNATVVGVSLQVFEKAQGFNSGWADLSFDNVTIIQPHTLLEQIDTLRANFFKDKNVEVSITIQRIDFEKGSNFEDWVAENKYNLEDFKNKITQ